MKMRIFKFANGIFMLYDRMKNKFPLDSTRPSFTETRHDAPRVFHSTWLMTIPVPNKD
jgi:hypothetical protein